MKRKRLQVTTPVSIARKGRTLQEWTRLARRSPRAVPVNVQRTIQRRNPQLADELGYS